MISSLRLKNFRGFRSQTFNFSTINVFVGPNNSGKSSAISALNIIAQTITDNQLDAPVLLRGRFDDLGTFHDTVYHNTARSPLGFELRFDDFSLAIEFRYRPQRREIEVVRYEVRDKYAPLFLYKSSGDSYELAYHGTPFEDLFRGRTKRRPTFRGLSVIDRNLFDIRVRPQNVSATATAAKLEITEDQQKNAMEVERRLMQFRRRLYEEFNGYDALGPFREPPNRTYLFSGGAPNLIGRTGANAIDMIVGDSFRRGRAQLGLTEAATKWFESANIASRLVVKPISSRHFEVCLQDGSGRQYNLCDVGFGCSQVLPVLVGAMNCAAGSQSNFAHVKFAVQEPEIHLHPNAQAELATYLADIARRIRPRGQLFVETHSDTLIIRLQKHVADGTLDHNDLKIFYCERGNDVCNVTEIGIDKFGILDRDFPHGFFPQRQEESRSLAKATSKAISEDS